MEVENGICPDVSVQGFTTHTLHMGVGTRIWLRNHQQMLSVQGFTTHTLHTISSVFIPASSHPGTAQTWAIKQPSAQCALECPWWMHCALKQSCHSQSFWQPCKDEAYSYFWHKQFWALAPGKKKKSKHTDTHIYMNVFISNTYTEAYNRNTSNFKIDCT